ncbi:MAG: hypothetical protein ACK4ON_08350 [Bacteroidia bacterium]
MNFGKRLRLYLTGVLLGCIAVYFLLIYKRDRNFTAWLPKERILAEIKEKPFSDDEKTICIIQCLNTDTASLKLILSEAEVNFGNSLVNEKPYPIYVLNTNKDNTETSLSIQIGEKELKIIRTTVKCDCN